MSPNLVKYLQKEKIELEKQSDYINSTSNKNLLKLKKDLINKEVRNNKRIQAKISKIQLKLERQKAKIKIYENMKANYEAESRSIDHFIHELRQLDVTDNPNNMIDFFNNIFNEK